MNNTQLHCFVSKIVPKEYVQDWVFLKPRVFFKGNEPHGLVAVVPNGKLFIAATARDNRFTKSMIKYIIELNKTNDIVLITDQEDDQDRLFLLLLKRGFTIEFKDGIMISTRGRTD